jgi:hypothetical protein
MAQLLPVDIHPQVCARIPRYAVWSRVLSRTLEGGGMARKGTLFGGPVISRNPVRDLLRRAEQAAALAETSLSTALCSSTNL